MTRRLTTLAGFLALLAVVATAWVVSRRDADEGAAPQPSAEEPRGAPAPASFEADLHPASAPVREAARPTAAAPPGDAVEAGGRAEPGIAVQVVGQDGRPVEDAGVALECALPGSESRDSVRARTDARGCATLRPPEQVLRMAARFDAQLEFAVVADVPLLDAPRVDLGRTPRSAEPVVLRLPPFGSVEVAVHDADGAPTDAAIAVALFWRTPGSEEPWDRIGTPRAHARGGRARLPIVPLGKELLLRSSGSPGRQAGPDVVVPGPRRDGEVVRAAVRLGAPRTFLVGRVVDERGEPVTRPVAMAVAFLPADAPADFVPERGTLTWRRQEIDAEGRFRMAVTGSAAGPDRRPVLLADHAVEGSEVVLAARAPLPHALPPGQDVDIGTLVLRPKAEERPLCSGRVVDGAGKPVDGARVSAGFWDRDGGRWVALHRQPVRTDRDGRFTVRTTIAPPEEFWVSATVRDLVPARLATHPGAGDLLLVLARGGSLRARIAAPAGFPLHLLVGRIVDPQGRTREPDQFAGRFGADQLVPGTYEVVVCVADSRWEVTRVRGVEVRAGERASDARLGAIDVGGACRVLTLRLVDDARQPVADQRVRIGDASGDVSVPVQRGKVLAVVPATPSSFTVLLADGRRGTALAQDGDQVVVVR